MAPYSMASTGLLGEPNEKNKQTIPATASLGTEEEGGSQQELCLNVSSKSFFRQLLKSSVIGLLVEPHLDYPRFNSWDVWTLDIQLEKY